MGCLWFLRQCPSATTNAREGGLYNIVVETKVQTVANRTSTSLLSNNCWGFQSTENYLFPLLPLTTSSCGDHAQQ